MNLPPDRDTREFLRGLEAGTKFVPGTDAPAPWRHQVHPGLGGFGGGGDWLRRLLPGSDYDYEAQAGDLWRNSAVAACLRVWKANFPQPSLQVRKTRARGRDRAIPGHPLIRLWNRPNKAYDRFALISSFITAALCDGNAYLMKVRSAAGIPVELWWIPPWMLRPIWDAAGDDYVSAYEYRVNGKLFYLRPADVIHYRHGGPDPRNERVAMSELKAAAARSVCGLNECDGFTATIMRNMGIAGVYIRPAFEGGRINRDDAETLKDQWRERTTGERRGDAFVNPGTFIIDQLGHSPEEMALDKIPARLEDQIAGLTGTPAMLAGLTSSAEHKTHANYGEARKSFYEDTLIPCQGAVAECLEHNLLDDPGIGDAATEEVGFSYDGIACLAEDQDRVWARAWTGYEKGIAKRSESRDMVGLESDESDDVYFVPGQGEGDDAEPPPDHEPPASKSLGVEGENRPHFRDQGRRGPWDGLRW